MCFIKFCIEINAKCNKAKFNELFQRIWVTEMWCEIFCYFFGFDVHIACSLSKRYKVALITLLRIVIPNYIDMQCNSDCLCNVLFLVRRDFESRNLIGPLVVIVFLIMTAKFNLHDLFWNLNLNCDLARESPTFLWCFCKYHDEPVNTKINAASTYFCSLCSIHLIVEE